MSQANKTVTPNMKSVLVSKEVFNALKLIQGKAKERGLSLRFDLSVVATAALQVVLDSEDAATKVINRAVENIRREIDAQDSRNLNNKGARELPQIPP